MYESEAYEILHIKRGSSQEEIKEAYAALSKSITRRSIRMNFSRSMRHI